MINSPVLTFPGGTYLSGWRGLKTLSSIIGYVIQMNVLEMAPSPSRAINFPFLSRLHLLPSRLVSVHRYCNSHLLPIQRVCEDQNDINGDLMRFTIPLLAFFYLSLTRKTCVFSLQEGPRILQSLTQSFAPRTCSEEIRNADLTQSSWG